MNPEPAYPRPSQVTVAGWTVAAASVVAILAVFQAMGDLNSVDMREEVARALSGGTFGGLGIDVDQALRFIRWCLYVGGVAAVVTGILGVYVLQRNHAARIVLSIAAVPVVLTAPFAGSLPGMVVGAGALMLWSRPARDWFAGRPVEPTRRVRPPQPAPRPADEQRQVRGLRMPDAPAPAPTPAWGAPPPAAPPAEPHLDFPAPTTAPVWPTAPVPTVRPDGRLDQSARFRAGQPGRPRQVRLACLVTWVFAAMSGAGALLLLAMIGVARDELVDQIVADPRWDGSLDRDLIVPAVLTFGSIVVLWCVVNAVLAWFVWRGRRGAWVGLCASIGLAALFSTAGFPLSLLHMAALAVSLGMLLSPPARRWFARG